MVDPHAIAPDGRTHAWCGYAALVVLVSSASGPRVSGFLSDWNHKL